MKKILFALLTTIFLGASLFPAQASLGLIKPTSKIYFMQPVIESLRLFFTFSNQAKADYLIELSERRVEEINLLPSIELTNRYTNHFQQLEQIVNQTQNEEQKTQIAEKIKTASLHQQEALAQVYNQVPIQAQEAILNAQENSSKHVEKVIFSSFGQEQAQNYAAQTAQIIQLEKIGQINQLEQVPLESTPQANPDESIPKVLQPNQGINPGQNLQELKIINPNLEIQNEAGSNGQSVEPVKPAPIQSPTEMK